MPATGIRITSYNVCYTKLLRKNLTRRDETLATLGDSLALMRRFVSHEGLETRSPMELSVYRHLYGIAHDVVAEFFRNNFV